jgi:hypothetical protein
MVDLARYEAGLEALKNVGCTGGGGGNSHSNWVADVLSASFFVLFLFDPVKGGGDNVGVCGGGVGRQRFASPRNRN